jgi:small basic protein
MYPTRSVISIALSAVAGAAVGILFGFGLWSFYMNPGISYWLQTKAGDALVFAVLGALIGGIRAYLTHSQGANWG